MYRANKNRYEKMIYNRIGNSGLQISAISLGLWNNFGSVDPYENQKEIIHQAFDLGITYFDLANNYGPIPGSAEENFGKIMATDMKPYRDEMVIASKAGHEMWPGPYGNWNSRKSIIASADQSLRRTGLDYFDIFYSHRPDPMTPLAETAQALDQLVRQGKALYIGISKYSSQETQEIIDIFKELKTPFIIHQPSYNMFDRKAERGLFTTLGENKKGAVGFSSLAQGLLSDKYLKGIPNNSRANKVTIPFLTTEKVEPTINTVQKLNQIAQRRGQTLPQMALAWNLRIPELASVLIGASNPKQVIENVKALDNLSFSPEELLEIDHALSEYAPNQA